MNKNSIQFTETEGKILLLLLDGRAPRFVQHDQSISESTFKVHIRNIKLKIKKGWNNRAVKPETSSTPTRMQILVLERRAAGKSHLQIAQELEISFRTSWIHASAGMKRLGINCRNGYDLVPLRKALAALAESTPAPVEEKQ